MSEPLREVLRELWAASEQMLPYVPKDSDCVRPGAEDALKKARAVLTVPVEGGEPCAWVQISRHTGKAIAYGSTKDALYSTLQRLGFAITSGTQEPLYLGAPTQPVEPVAWRVLCANGRVQAGPFNSEGEAKQVVRNHDDKVPSELCYGPSKCGPHRIEPLGVIGGADV